MPPETPSDIPSKLNNPQDVETAVKPVFIQLTANAQHQNEIYGFVKQLYDEFGFDFFQNDRHLDLADIEKDYSQPKGIFYAWQDPAKDNQIIGTGAVRQLKENTAELRRFYTLPEYRGLGLGRLINNTLITFAQDAGYQKIVLESHTSMPDAMRFYKKAGFYEIAPYAGEPLDYSDIAFAYDLI